MPSEQAIRFTNIQQDTRYYGSEHYYFQPLLLHSIGYRHFPSLSFSYVFNMQHYCEMTAFQSCWFIRLFMCNSILTVCICCHNKTRVTTDTKDTLNSRACFHVILCFTQESVKLTSMIMFH